MCERMDNGCCEEKCEPHPKPGCTVTLVLRVGVSLTSYSHIVRREPFSGGRFVARQCAVRLDAHTVVVVDALEHLDDRREVDTERDARPCFEMAKHALSPSRVLQIPDGMVGSRASGWAPDSRWSSSSVLHQPPWSFGFDSQTRRSCENDV